MAGMEVVVCQYCGQKIDVLPVQQPVACVEREDSARRFFLLIDADNWLLHRCEIGGD